MIHHYKLTIVVVLGLILLLVMSVYATHDLFTSKVPGANDFYPRWKGAQLFWQEGIDPYSEAATAAIQQGIYGRLARPDEDQLLFVYPFYTIFFVLPLIDLSYPWVQAIWLVTLQFSLIAAVILCLLLVEWRMPFWLLALTLLWTIAFYHSTRTIILGQFAALIFLWLVGALLALKWERDNLAGALLALTTIKPQMSFLVIPALLLWAISQRRWRFAIAFAVTLGVLAGISFLLLPTWFSSFIEQVLYYPAYTITGSPIWVITGYYLPQLGRPAEIVLSIALLLYLLYQWRRLPHLSAGSFDFLILIGLTLVVTNMIVVRTATTNYVMMYIPLFLGLKVAAERLPGGHGWVAAFYLVSTVSSWLLFLNTLSGDLEHPIVYLPLPITLLVMLIWELSARSRKGSRRSKQRRQAM